MKRLFLFLIPAILFSCKNNEQSASTADKTYEKKLQEDLINAKEGDTILIPEGVFAFSRSLSLDDIKNVTIKGAGIDKTILSFKNQTSGAEGFKVVADNFTLSDLTIQDTKGDAVKIQNSKNCTMRRVKIEWTGGPDEKNGGYGLYPVTCDGVLIEDCDVSGASDAGIYVGQSKNIVVRKNHAHHNVAGIEIENSTNSEVYENLSENNTGGVLVFDLPGLPAKNGTNCIVRDNIIRENNHKNFAPEGNIVGIVPPGTGFICLAAKNCEVRNNQFINNKTIGAAVASYLITEKPFTDSVYIPHVSDIHIHHNSFQREFAIPDVTEKFGLLINGLFKAKSQDIIWDGILADGKTPKICIHDNTAEELRFANLDAANNFKNVNTDMSKHNCTISEVVLQ